MSTTVMIASLVLLGVLGWLVLRSTESDQEANMRLHALLWRVWEDGK